MAPETLATPPVCALSRPRVKGLTQQGGPCWARPRVSAVPCLLACPGTGAFPQVLAIRNGGATKLLVQRRGLVFIPPKPSGRGPRGEASRGNARSASGAAGCARVVQNEGSGLAPQSGVPARTAPPPRTAPRGRRPRHHANCHTAWPEDRTRGRALTCLGSMKPRRHVRAA